jgi:cytochrome P450
VQIECKDLVFAGVDSTGFSLAGLCWHLARHPHVYNQLKRHVSDGGPSASAYVQAVVKESLRLTLVNPVRLSRVVPEQGWTYGSFHFRPGTVVGCSATELHLDPLVFPDPDAFRPERWLDATEEMNRNWFAFGKGSRSCIAQNLAQAELHAVTAEMASRDLLAGARPVGDKLETSQWFNAHVKAGKLEIEF